MTKRWKPEIGKRYFSVDAYNGVAANTWGGDRFDQHLYSSGNYFKTKTEARAAAKKVKDLLLSLHEPTTECSQLPKLTVEVFNRPDCPEWAKYAAVSKFGCLTFFEKKPVLGNNSFLPLSENNTTKLYCNASGRWDASDWQNSLIERPAKLPKLTTEVFDRPGCPERAQYAAVSDTGIASYFEEAPYLGTHCFGCRNGKTWIVGGSFDPSDWKNSLIERPAILPDWCKVDAVGWCERYGYFKVTSIDDYSEGVYVQRVDDKSKGYLPFRTVCSEAVHANSRPYNEAEMKSLVGKPITMSDGSVCLCTAYNKQAKEVIFVNMHWNAQELMDSGCTIDDKPCFFLEHLNEKGEWVE